MSLRTVQGYPFKKTSASILQSLNDGMDKSEHKSDTYQESQLPIPDVLQGKPSPLKTNIFSQEGILENKSSSGEYYTEESNNEEGEAEQDEELPET